MNGRSIKGKLERLKKRIQAAAQARDRASMERLFKDDYYLVDERGAVIDREQMIESILDSRAGYAEFFFRPPLHTDYYSQQGTIREVSEIKLTEEPANEKIPPANGSLGNYLFTATYVRGAEGSLQVIANTITKKDNSTSLRAWPVNT
jgi:hypothetical protein